MFSASYIKEYKTNLKLAYPVILGQVGHMITQITDGVMVGHLGASPLAASAFANSVFALALMFVIGLTTGITTLVGKAHGEGNETMLHSLIGNGFWSTTLFSVLLVTIALAAQPLLHHMGQDPEVVRQALPYYQVLCWSVVPLMMFLSLKHSFDGMEWTLPGMVISIVSNVLNVGLNYLLIYGNGGFPALGLLGAGYATLISRICMPVIAVLVLWLHPRLNQYRTALWQFKVNRETIVQVFKLGIPIGIQYLLEGGAFVFGALMIGWLGTTSLAAHHIAISIVTFTYMFATGISSTAAIRVSNLRGAKRFGELLLVSKSLFVMMVGVELAFMGIIILGHQFLPTFFILDTEVVLLASELLIIASLFQLFDGIQILSMGALRGFSDVKIPTAIALFSYWIISLPLGYCLMKFTDVGAAGIWYGLLVGLFFAAVFSTIRYVILLKRTVTLARA